jgi:aspartate/methionine/tyrosine aminotransferase
MASVPQESTIRRMTRLAVQHEAVNLSQGFPNEPPPFDMVWAGVSALVGGTSEGAQRLAGLQLDQLLQPGESAAQLPLKLLLQRAASHLDLFNQYSFPMGTVELRQCISAYTARFYGERFRPDPADEVTVCLGATEGFATSLRALCAPGDKVAWFQPYHELYPAQVTRTDMRGQTLPPPSASRLSLAPPSAGM